MLPKDVRLFLLMLIMLQLISFLSRVPRIVLLAGLFNPFLLYLMERRLWSLPA